MTNTFLLEGPDDPEAIIRDTPYGLYCVALGGGQVNTATGDFVFGITEAYMIENGEITEPVRAAQLIGNGPETLRLVDAVGSDFDTWAGTCGKDGQGVPVSSGQPTLRVARAHRGRHGRHERVSGVDLLDARAFRRRFGARRRADRGVRVRSLEVDVNAFEGDVESLATAEIEGVGVRVIVDQRQGYAWAGSLDPDVVADTLADARDNAAFGAP